MPLSPNERLNILKHRVSKAGRYAMWSPESWFAPPCERNRKEKKRKEKKKKRIGKKRKEKLRKVKKRKDKERIEKKTNLHHE